MATSTPSIGVAVVVGVFWSTNEGGVVVVFTYLSFFLGEDENGTALFPFSILLIDGLHGVGTKWLSR